MLDIPDSAFQEQFYGVQLVLYDGKVVERII